jgi:hypothetical protein
MTSVPTTHVIGSASIWVLGQVAGPRHVAKVLHAGRSAVYVDLDGTCLAVLAARAVQVPCGVRTMLPALPEVGPGDEAVVYDGSVQIPGCEVLVTDIVDTTVPVLTAPPAGWGAGELHRLASPRLRGTRETLPADALRPTRGGPGPARSGPGAHPAR